MQLQVHDITGAVVGNAEASDVVFGASANQDLLHQALVYYQANQRQGSSNTLTRGLVSGGGRKPFAQKGTGRARQGSIRSPLQRHGGVVFGPHPRSYRQRMPKRMRRQAIRVALSGKVAGDQVKVVRDIDGAEPKTKAMAVVLGALGVTRSALLVMSEQHAEQARAVRNLPRIKAVRADLLNVLDLLRYDTVIMTTEAVQQANDLWSETARKPRKARAGSALPVAKAAVEAPPVAEPEAIAEPEAVAEPEAAPEPKAAPKPRASRAKAAPKAVAAPATEAAPAAKAAPRRRATPRPKAAANDGEAKPEQPATEAE